MIFYIIILLLLISLSAVLLIHTWHLWRALERQSLLSDDVAGGCESLGFIGCSVVCSGIYSTDHIGYLLGQEYRRYEVIVVLDSSCHPASLREIISRYKLVRVNCTPTHELPTQIRALYRSRQRNFRRLIVIDTPHHSTAEDMNAGVTIASYEHILPLCDGLALRDRAIESLAIMLCEERAQSAPCISSLTCHATLFRRDIVILHGGFNDSLRRAMRGAYCTHLPITYGIGRASEKFSPRTTIITLGGALFIMISAAIEPLAGVSILLTLCMLLILARYRTHLLQPRRSSIREILYDIDKMIDIFLPRKFIFK